MILYHGTNVDFETIDLRKSNKYKDFGQGFYLTDIRSQAEELAAKKSRLFGGYPIIQEYEFDEALRVVYNSRVYRQLLDDGGDLYSQSPSYVYELLKNER